MPILSARYGAGHPQSAGDGACLGLRVCVNEGDPAASWGGHAPRQKGRWPATARAPAPRRPSRSET
ncbi:hypothetical protein NMC40_19165 [Proteus mirabilis]|uniref:hypothetical protein n=1 Tax=Proteus mirabilis TaxID=584 RepID=UPI0021BF6FDF|nr:hypothetical protein [Proteus mirabilis]MCT9020925.1 hypothetical protein [Proteus mirabilis]